jgi:hypothetical protein
MALKPRLAERRYEPTWLDMEPDVRAWLGNPIFHAPRWHISGLWY